MSLLIKTTTSDPVNVLLIGNNPIEMGPVLDKFRQVRKRKIVTEIAFDLRSILERLANFHPNYIFIDDNIGREELRLAVKKLSANKKTRDIPITILKNSNYEEAAGSNLIHDYLLKQSLTAESLYNTIKNTLRIKRTQRLLLTAFAKRRSLLKNLFEKKGLNLVG